VPTATPTIATSTAFFDIRAIPVTIRGHARPSVVRPDHAVTVDQPLPRGAVKPMYKISARNGSGEAGHCDALLSLWVVKGFRHAAGVSGSGT